MEKPRKSACRLPVCVLHFAASKAVVVKIQTNQLGKLFFAAIIADVKNNDIVKEKFKNYRIRDFKQSWIRQQIHTCVTDLSSHNSNPMFKLDLRIFVSIQS